MKIAIATDTNSSISPSEVIDTNIFVLPMPFLIDGKEYFEGINLSQDEFFQKQIEGANISTSQPSLYALMDFWREILKTFDAIVYIPMSSALSSSMENARTLSKEDEFLGKVFVVDNKRISLVQKQSVYDAQKLAEKGKSPQEIVEYLERTSSENSIYIMVPDLKYLKKGGRLTPAVAMIGTILKIKPVLQIQGGKLDSYAKALTVPKAKEIMISALKKDLETRFLDLKNDGRLNVSVEYSFNSEAGNDFKNDIEKEIPNIKVSAVNPLSLSISTHIGPNCIAVVVVSKIK